jgi:hypothetical protein
VQSVDASVLEHDHGHALKEIANAQETALSANDDDGGLGPGAPPRDAACSQGWCLSSADFGRASDLHGYGLLCKDRRAAR